MKRRMGSSWFWSAGGHFLAVSLIWFGSLLPSQAAPSFTTMKVDLAGLELPETAPIETTAEPPSEEPTEAIAEETPEEVLPPEPTPVEPIEPESESEPEPEAEDELPPDMTESLPPKPKPIEPEAEPVEAPSLASQAQTEVGEGARVGAAAEGGVADYYLALVEQKIGRRWRPSKASAAGQGEAAAVVRFSIGSDGRILSPSIENSSGLSVFDRQAIRSVLDASPLPRPPAGHAAGLEIRFTFAYTP